MSEESLKPDVKQAGLKILEKTASSLVSEIVTPYAEYYAAEKGGSVGAILKPFIDDLEAYIQAEVVDRIDGVDDIK